MPIKSKIIELKTSAGISLHNITPNIVNFLATTTCFNGQVYVFSRHTTTALVINEDEERLLEDLKGYLKQLVPPAKKYLHNDLPLRKHIPPDEPMNAHAHLMAMMLNTSEVIPVVEGHLALGTWQSLLLVDLDGPRNRTVLVQIDGAPAECC
jgi:secondary thiamine-phosphate synthase enzyme